MLIPLEKLSAPPQLLPFPFSLVLAVLQGGPISYATTSVCHQFSPSGIAVFSFGLSFPDLSSEFLNLLFPLLCPCYVYISVLLSYPVLIQRRLVFLHHFFFIARCVCVAGGCRFHYVALAGLELIL